MRVFLFFLLTLTVCVSLSHSQRHRGRAYFAYNQQPGMYNQMNSGYRIYKNPIKKCANNRCYLITQTKMTYFKGVQFCKKQKLRPVQIKSQIQNDDVFGLTKSIQISSYFIGGSDFRSKGDYRFEDTNKELELTFFSDAKLDEHGPKENCIMVGKKEDSQSKWSHIDCNKEFNFICEPASNDNVPVNKDPEDCMQQTVKCAAHAQCKKNEENQHRCTCDPGYSGDGYSCTWNKDCKSGVVKCGDFAVCRRSGDHHECKCVDEFVGDGFDCKYQKDCNYGYQCPPHSTCEVSNRGHECVCDQGFVGDGFNCTFSMDCRAEHIQCGLNATCVPTQLGYECRCDKDFVGNGFACKYHASPKKEKKEEKKKCNKCKEKRQKRVSHADFEGILNRNGTLVNDKSLIIGTIIVHRHKNVSPEK